MVALRDTPYGRITVSERDGQVAAYRDQALWLTTGTSSGEVTAHLAALAHDAPRRMLLLGGTLDGLPARLLAHRPDRLDAIELDRAAFELVSARLSHEAREALSDPPLRVRFDDPRRALTRGDAYDLIVVAMPEAESGAANRFFTRECFASARARLADRGVVVVRLALAENLVTPLSLARVASVEHALRDVFAHVMVLPAENLLLLFASNVPIPDDPREWVDRFARRGIEADLVSPAYIRYLLGNDRRTELSRGLREATVPSNTDSHPVCYRYAAAHWVRRVWPGAPGFIAPARSARSGALAAAGGVGPVVALAAAAAIVTVALSRRSPRRRRLALVVLAAFAGMALDTVLLLHYQLTNGVLFQNIGLLVTAFMAGLTLGGALVGAVPWRRWAALGVVTLALLAVVTMAGVRAGYGSLVFVSIAMAVVGLCVAGIFAHAARDDAAASARLVSPLYAADVLGGAAAAVIVPLLLVPAVGLIWTAAVAGVVALVSLALA